MELPVFCGFRVEDPEVYLEVFKHARVLYKWHKALWSDVLSEFLECNALVWYNSLALVVKSSWNALTSALVEQFKKNEPTSAMLQHVGGMSMQRILLRVSLRMHVVRLWMFLMR